MKQNLSERETQSKFFLLDFATLQRNCFVNAVTQITELDIQGFYWRGLKIKVILQG